MRIKIVPLFYTEILKLEILKCRYFMQCLFHNIYTQLGIRECNHFFLLQYIWQDLGCPAEVENNCQVVAPGVEILECSYLCFSKCVSHTGEKYYSTIGKCPVPFLLCPVHFGPILWNTWTYIGSLVIQLFNSGRMMYQSMKELRTVN